MLETSSSTSPDNSANGTDGHGGTKGEHSLTEEDTTVSQNGKFQLPVGNVFIHQAQNTPSGQFLVESKMKG